MGNRTILRSLRKRRELSALTSRRSVNGNTASRSTKNQDLEKSRNTKRMWLRDVVLGNKPDVHDNLKCLLVSVCMEKLEDKINPEANLNDEIVCKILFTKGNSTNIKINFTINLQIG